MNFTCECFKIGGPFIAEDPSCQEHGLEAQARERRERERGQDASLCTCGKPATFGERPEVVAMCERLKRPVPRACDACAWERITRALGDDVAMDVAELAGVEPRRSTHGRT